MNEINGRINRSELKFEIFVEERTIQKIVHDLTGGLSLYESQYRRCNHEDFSDFSLVIIFLKFLFLELFLNSVNPLHPPDHE